MNELIEFLTKCNDEDEAAAAASAMYGDIAVTSWLAANYGERNPDEAEIQGVLEDGDHVYRIAKKVPLTDAKHIASHDPARVLRECAARRRAIARHRPVGTYGETLCARCADCDAETVHSGQYPCFEILEWAQSYVDRPDFKEEWRVT